MEKVQLTIQDERMLLLIKLLKQKERIKYDTQFCDVIGLKRQNLINIKNGTQSFTVAQITAACKAFNVDANWILGIEKIWL